MPTVDSILAENERRLQRIHSPFDPLTGLNSVGRRQEVVIPDFLEGATLYLPVPMLNNCELVLRVLEAGSITDFLRNNGMPAGEQEREAVAEGLIRARNTYDYPFWAVSFAVIHNKETGVETPFILNRPQRTLLTPELERQRLAGEPIRLVVVKARQLGGSTNIQTYMVWIQTCLAVGLNSLIVGHLSAVSVEVQDMLYRIIQAYPTRLLHPMGASFSVKEPKFVSVFGHPNIHRIPQRDCKVKIGTAVQPNSARGGAYNLIHCTEVGLWKETEKMSPAQIVASATSGVLYRPDTMIVYESTANGTDNLFHSEYKAAKDGSSQFHPLFVAWYDIDYWSLPFTTERHRRDFAQKLWRNREQTMPANDREQSGAYMWRIWLQGATLEALHWYSVERSKYSDPAYMFSEFPSDDVEAFVYSGDRIFDPYYVRQMEPPTKTVPLVGDVYGDASSGKAALRNLRFKADANANLWVWEPPEIDPEEKISHRYIVAVDIGGRSHKADWSVIVVIDRYWLMEGDKPAVVAQMRYHDDMDRLAWKAAQVAAWYDNALLVIESNTIETHDTDRMVDGDHAPFIIRQLRGVYPNLYSRRTKKTEDVNQESQRKYGFHTNPTTKPKLIDNLVTFVRENLYVERDKRALDELLQYERKPNGAYGALKGCHDDMLMARAIALYISTYEMPLPKRIPRNADTFTVPEVISEASNI